MQKFVSIFFILFLSTILSIGSYERNPYVDPQTWKNLSVYFLPEKHPIKSDLDKIFSKERVTQSSKSLEKAGFLSPMPRKFSGTVVTKHPKLKGYLVKLYTDEQHNIETKDLVDRIFGAFYAQQSINAHKYNDIMSVPKKWLYPLPVEPSPKPGSHRKNFILIVEDVKIVNKENNKKFWSGVTMNPSKLNAVYTVLQEAGLSDSMYIFNMPYTKSGKISFIDTQIYHQWPIDFSKLTRYLSPKMQTYWDRLVKNGGPK